MTWITNLVVGERSCEYSAWFKSRHWYDKLPQEDENRLVAWKAEHTAMVRAHRDELLLAGYNVTVEDQNKLTYHGKVADVGGKPDLVGIRGLDAVVSDCKSGKERDSDVVQVAVYIVLGRHALPMLGDRAVRGEVVYKDRVRPVSADDADALRVRIVDQVVRLSAPTAPPTTPSHDECAKCDIASCKDRWKGSEPEAEPLEGGLF